MYPHWELAAPPIYYEFFYHKNEKTCFLYIKDEFSQYYYLEEYFSKSKKINLSTISLLNKNPEIARKIKKELNNGETKTNGLFNW